LPRCTGKWAYLGNTIPFLEKSDEFSENTQIGIFAQKSIKNPKESLHSIFDSEQ